MDMPCNSKPEVDLVTFGDNSDDWNHHCATALYSQSSLLFIIVTKSDLPAPVETNLLLFFLIFSLPFIRYSNVSVLLCRTMDTYSFIKGCHSYRDRKSVV